MNIWTVARACVTQRAQLSALQQQRLGDLLLSDKVEKVDDEIGEDDYFN